MLRRVRDRQMRMKRSEILKQSLSFARNPKQRHSVLVGNDLDIVPGDLSSPTGLQCF